MDYKNKGLIVLALIIVVIGIYFYFQKNKELLKTVGYEQNTQQTQKPKKVIMAFIATWCGWSKKFMAQIESEIKPKLKAESLPIEIEIIDCDKQEEMCQKFNVQGFPTIIIKHEDKHHMYNGDRSTKDLIEVVNKL
jgi:thiol-disulfide isomerase/thioredoxin